MTHDVLAAAVGPVTAGPLRDAGATVRVPDRYRLGALIRLVSEELVDHRVLRLRSGDTELELRGRAVTVDGRPVKLGPNALALFKALARPAPWSARRSSSAVCPTGPTITRSRSR